MKELSLLFKAIETAFIAIGCFASRDLFYSLTSAVANILCCHSKRVVPFLLPVANTPDFDNTYSPNILLFGYALAKNQFSLVQSVGACIYSLCGVYGGVH